MSLTNGKIFIFDGRVCLIDVLDVIDEWYQALQTSGEDEFEDNLDESKGK